MTDLWVDTAVTAKLQLVSPTIIEDDWIGYYYVNVVSLDSGPVVAASQFDYLTLIKKTTEID